MTNLFLSAAHCAAFARRAARNTKSPCHVLLTGHPTVTRRVVTDSELIRLGLRCADSCVEYSAEPFAPQIVQLH